MSRDTAYLRSQVTRLLDWIPDGGGLILTAEEKGRLVEAVGGYEALRNILHPEDAPASPASAGKPQGDKT